MSDQKSKKDLYRRNFKKLDILCKTCQGLQEIIPIKKTNDKQLNGFEFNNMIVNDSKFITSGFGNFCGSVA